MIIEQQARQAVEAARQLRLSKTSDKRAVLQQFSDALIAQEAALLSANQQDLVMAKSKGLSEALMDRLTLNPERIQTMASGVRAIAAGKDPVGRTLAQWSCPNGLHIQRVSVPIGVLAVIYESRPNVTADAAALSIMSGNAVILRGGSESAYSSQAIYQLLAEQLQGSALPQHAVQMLASQNHAAVDHLIQLDQHIDVVIPRGGRALIEHLMEHSKIPLFKHLEGLCHTYIHQDADLAKALAVTVNAKMRRPGICGATETILVDQAIAVAFLPELVQSLEALGCEVRGDRTACNTLSDLKQASVEDWQTEYLAAVVSIRVVEDFSAAIDHIQQYSSKHTDAIITENVELAKAFSEQIDSAIVMVNTSTQFADGGEFGMGAEIGIATGKLHARGPVGVEQLNTFKYVVESDGAVRV